MSGLSKRPRLAYLFSRYPVVSHTFCDNEILALSGAGWEVMVASVYPPKNDFRHERLSATNIPVLYAPSAQLQRVLEYRAKRKGIYPQKLIDRYDDAFGKNLHNDQRCRNILYIAEMLKRWEIDHVHLHFANHATHSALFLKALAGISFSFTPQAQDFLVDLESRALLVEMCEQAAFVVAPCDYAQRKLEELCPNVSGKVIRIYNGIDPSGYTQASPGSTPLRVVSVGRLIEFKGFRHLIAAVQKVREAGVIVHLDIMGDGPLRSDLESQAADLGLNGQVTFHGSVSLEQMKNAFQKSDVFALACIADSKGATDVFPTVITEAMLSGLPVLSSRIAGVPEQVMHGETGFLTEPGDETALADALIRLGTEPGLSERLGKQGWKRAKAMFAIQSTIPHLEKALTLTFRESEKNTTVLPYRIAAYYNLSDNKYLRKEIKILEEYGGLLFVQPPVYAERDLEKSKLPLERFFWMPDGMVLEMEWFNRSKERAFLEQLRTELSTAVEGELFFESARRALWWYSTLRNLHQLNRANCGKTVQLLYTPGGEESLMVWITSKLSDIPFVLGTKPVLLSKKLAQRILGDAVAVCPEQFWQKKAFRKILSSL